MKTKILTLLIGLACFGVKAQIATNYGICTISSTNAFTLITNAGEIATNQENELHEEPLWVIYEMPF